MNILLLGASGFIGNEVLKALESTDGFNIMALENKRAVNSTSDSVNIIKQNLGNLSLKDLPYAPDVIIHAARYRTGRFGKLGRRYVAAKGKKANKRLMKQVNEAAHQPKIIYISGSLMYGNAPNKLITEDFPTSPISFAREYVAAETVFLDEIKRENPNLLMLRVPWVIGSGSWFEWNYLKHIKENNKVPLYGKADNIMTFIDLRDLAENIIKILPLKQKGVLNLFNTNYLTQKDFALKLGGLFNRELETIDLDNDERISSAVKEAFQSNIQLSSKHKELQNELQQNRHAIEETIAHYGKSKA